MCIDPRWGCMPGPFLLGGLSFSLGLILILLPTGSSLICLQSLLMHCFGHEWVVALLATWLLGLWVFQRLLSKAQILNPLSYSCMHRGSFLTHGKGMHIPNIAAVKVVFLHLRGVWHMCMCCLLFVMEILPPLVVTSSKALAGLSSITKPILSRAWAHFLLGWFANRWETPFLKLMLKINPSFPYPRHQKCNW